MICRDCDQVKARANCADGAGTRWNSLDIASLWSGHKLCTEAALLHRLSQANLTGPTITKPIEGAFQESTGSVALEARKTDLTRVSVTVSGETAPAVDDGQNGRHDAARMPPRTGVCLAQSSTRLQSN